VALAARELLAADGVAARVVSMPSFELFRAQDPAYREAVLPAELAARVSVEAASTFGWTEWTGCRGEALGIDRFGVSAPGADALRHLGITPEAVAAAAARTLAVARA
jgi:transketolase